MTSPHEGLTHLDSNTPFNASNIALLGSDIDHKLRNLSAHGERAWETPGIGSGPGVWSWTVDDFKLVSWRVGELGTGDFREGDSFIVLKSVAPVPSKPDVLIHDIHFWLGSKTSQDEAGVAAYKSVELDEFLGGAPTQHRQTQGSETPAFLGLFHPHFIVALGNHASGFHHVSPATSASLHLAAPRLWAITQHSKNDVRVTEVPANAEFIRRGDVFILDLGYKLLQWNGRECQPREKAKGAEVSRHWVDARDGKATLQVFEDGQGDTAFFLSLGVPVSSLPLHLHSSPTLPTPPPAPTHPTSYSLLSKTAYPSLF